jgi:hypothetical protein
MSMIAHACNPSTQEAGIALTNGLRKCGIYTQWNFMQP